jgi:hypothetical protein
MANHVDTYVSFTNIGEKGKAKLLSLYQRLEGYSEEHTWDLDASQFFGIKNEDDSPDGPGWRSWNTENMGSKWVNVQEAMEESLALTSAWCVPFELIEYICNQIAEVEPNLFVTVTYEDEAPLFMGWTTWHHGSYDEGSEWDTEEINEWMRGNNETLASYWDEDAEDWKEEYESEVWDILWEEMSEFRDNVLHETLSEEEKWYFENEQTIIAEMNDE